MIKTFFMLDSPEHEIFSANKYKLCLARKNLQLLIISDLLAGQISCSAEFGMKKKFYNLSARITEPILVTLNIEYHLSHF